MKTPPRHVVEELKRYAPALRLRWSKERQCFVLERQLGGRASAPRPVIYRRGADGQMREILCPENSDRYIAYHDRYIPIMDKAPLDRRLFWSLYSADAFRDGKYFVPRLEEREEAQEKRQERYTRQTFSDLSGEMYDHLQVMQGERTYMGGRR